MGGDGVPVAASPAICWPTRNAELSYKALVICRPCPSLSRCRSAAALRQRDKDGQGRQITSALYESSAFLVGQHMAGEAATGTPSPPMPARSGAWGIYETFPTLNGEKLFIGITSDNHWRSFCDKFDRADLLADERFRTNAD